MSSVKDKFVDKFRGWVEARRKVEDEITQARARIHALKESAKIIDRKIAEGEPWPETQLEDQRHSV